MFRLALKNQSIYCKQKAYTSSLLKLQRNKSHSAPHFQQAGFGKYLVILTPLAVGGGVIAYAKNDKEFRSKLVATIPGIDPVLKVLFQEEGNVVSKATQSINNATQKAVDVKNSVGSFFGAGSPSTEEKTEAAKIAPTKSKADAASAAAPPLPSITAPTPSKASSPSKTAQSTTSAAKATKDTTPAVSVKLPSAVEKPLPKSLVELEKSLDEAAQVAIKEYNKAINHLKQYSEDVKAVVDRVIENSDHSLWATLKNKTSARDTAVETAERSAQEARAHIDKLEQHVASVAKDVLPEVLEKTRRNIRLVSEELNKSKDELYNAKDSANLSERYWKKVEEARNYFVDQIESLFPGIDLSSKKLNLSKDDIDLFIMHAYSHVLAYQKELQKLHVEGESRLRRALDALKGEDHNEAVARQLEYLLEKEKQAINIENQKKIFRIQAESEAKLRQQLKKQAEAHADHLNDAVTEKEKELRRIFNRELNEKLSVEQAAYKIQLATMLGKLKGMDSALKDVEEELKARADADRQVHQAQALWSACSALWSSLRTIDPKVPWQQQLRPLTNEVAAVKSASQGDELVKIVLDGLPEEARTRGVYTENAIRERFLNVEKLARRLALVPEKDATIPTYLLSYLQSVFILQPSELISKAELNNEPVEFSALNTFDILNRTRYHVDRGNFVQALKYANLLQGASRKVANDWINETRLLLETQQAVNVLLAHAATSGLKFL